MRLAMACQCHSDICFCYTGTTDSRSFHPSVTLVERTLDADQAGIGIASGAATGPAGRAAARRRPQAPKNVWRVNCRSTVSRAAMPLRNDSTHQVTSGIFANNAKYGTCQFVEITCIMILFGDLSDLLHSILTDQGRSKCPQPFGECMIQVRHRSPGRLAIPHDRERSEREPEDIQPRVRELRAPPILGRLDAPNGQPENAALGSRVTAPTRQGDA